MKFRIMIVEDEPSLVTMLRYNLEKEGYAVDEAYDGEQAVTAIRAGLPDLVLLDWMLPGLSGLEVCRRLRRRPETAHIPVIMITARGEEADKIRGLDTGADDYLTKPFSVPELLARTKALLRRAQPARSRDTLSYGDVVMDLVSLRVERSGQPVHLGPTEFRLLRFLMENPGCVFSREELLNRIWGQDIHVEVRTVDVHIRRLRKALDKGNGMNLIRTVRSAGYALDERE
ncbi:phosphate regulon transcriptional regulatory protein PhoB [Haematospirillum jordaniae]|uniref:Phosphate regulon transcriptional regulatory protein PhoB n=1 Tax=Haematospirillum jordaniae TaxID=1549855 RepID=A0A145VS31_9PROT|nr:phosphate regulon transcriptional regulator PhoB [Haematospirillum jordaniae]AMW35912.1 two-component system response regulator [Haematospirillum jordaniae]NKD45939.1 phosphate regulon transcriptional regulatory protein PhoB [Haematospirillum jordaniae]NKD58017.1 phosphate regulon transcriptional regulatory protein PhoB [Haematospirillum jordaniae]NKD60051.1 phosphate regulon transcriptional regulatory protein PhoB [Haematospirillum jordaniae]NKD68014.1 phosphate regulon transcriptional reg